MKEYRKAEAVPEIPHYHLKSMGYLLLVFLSAIGLAFWGRLLGEGALPYILGVFFCLPVLMFIIILKRTNSVSCPSCKMKMKKEKRILIPTEHRLKNEIIVHPWNTFRCFECDKEWRVPAISTDNRQTIPEERLNELI